MIDRRGFIVVGVAALCSPRAAWTQQVVNPPRVGFLIPISAQSAAPLIAALHQRLRERGFIEGRTFVFEYRYAEGRMERLSDLAGDLVARNVDVILAVSTPATAAAKAQTSRIPIVMVETADPVASGLVASLGRPGGNVTGVSALTRDLSGKRLEMLKAAVPVLSRVGVLIDALNPGASIVLSEAERHGPGAISGGRGGRI